MNCNFFSDSNRSNFSTTIEGWIYFLALLIRNLHMKYLMDILNIHLSGQNSTRKHRLTILFPISLKPNWKPKIWKTKHTLCPTEDVVGSVSSTDRKFSLIFLPANKKKKFKTCDEKKWQKWKYILYYIQPCMYRSSKVNLHRHRPLRVPIDTLVEWSLGDSFLVPREIHIKPV